MIVLKCVDVPKVGEIESKLKIVIEGVLYKKNSRENSIKDYFNEKIDLVL